MMGETQLHDFVLLLDGESQSSYGCPVCLGNYGNLVGFLRTTNPLVPLNLSFSCNGLKLA